MCKNSPKYIFSMKVTLSENRQQYRVKRSTEKKVAQKN